MSEREPTMQMTEAFAHNALRKSEILDEEYYTKSKEYVRLLLHNTREAFLQERGTERGRLAYVPQFDFAPYNALFAHRHEIHPKVFAESVTALRSETEYHLTTLLGEIFNAETSRYRYRIVKGQICSEYSTEPFLDVMERGRQVRAQNGSRVQEREKAEIEGFAKIQQVLCDETTPLGTMMVSFSPPDEVYSHRFIDKHRVLQDEKGKRYIESRRYASVLGNKEFAEKIGAFDSRYQLDHEPDASFTLANPVQLTPGKTPFQNPDDVHRYLQQDNGGGMTDEEFNKKVLPAHRGYMKRYMERLENPSVTDAQRLEAFKALLVFAQQYPEFVKKQEAAGVIFDYTIGNLPSDKDISFMAMQQLTAMSLPCGELFGSGVLAAYGTAFGVAAAGGFGYGDTTLVYERDQYGSLYFRCPNGGCGKELKRPVGKLIPNCYHCNADVRC